MQVQRIDLPKLAKISFINNILGRIMGFQPIPPERKALSIIFQKNKQTFRVTTAHFDIAGGWRYRVAQHTFLRQHLQPKTMPYEVICGDFNSFRGKDYAQEMLQIQQAYGGKFSEASADISWKHDLHECTFIFPALTTFLKKSSIHYRQKLDHIFIKGFTSLETKRIDIKGSDHFPVLTILTEK